jgi:hypothetical protein
MCRAVVRKQFFFEKKNQKTFVCFSRRNDQQHGAGAAETSKSFLVLFFKKELLASFPERKTPFLSEGGWFSTNVFLA